MIIKSPSDIPSSEITPESVYKSRRNFIGQSAGLAMMAALPSTATAANKGHEEHLWLQVKLKGLTKTPYGANEKLTPRKDIIAYNNFYEFGTSKDDPAAYAKNFKTDPWSVTIDGEAEVTGTFNFEDIIKPHALEERIFRLRCVEAWSMVVPWVGFSLGDLLKRFKPTSRAKYVSFTTLYDPKKMPGQASSFSTIDWPYVEGLRIDEAMNPLCTLAVGLYGDALPAQNGAPLRLVIPWKYGFKSIKSIVKITFSEHEPATTWNQISAKEYGFYANVNPQVSHPRWSQKMERRLPNGLFRSNRIETKLFNGYEEQVSHMYANMDLTRFY
jgi:sulfoxide reductase catalytic subunit YedY